MKPLVVPQDAEVLTKDLLIDLLAGETCTVSIGVPSGWTAASENHLQVALDGDPIPVWPICTRPTIRLVARAASTSEAKALCGLAFGLLCAHNGGDGIVSVRPLTGVQPARDPETNAELASATVRVTVRTEPIDIGS